ncbi:c-type cytochrome [Variovorax arabinosiphilus]|uniref:c-type cytochrome n=1 Tax=Variovorax arabinosiphilus TaxID=3053498 RepID=UPI002578C595|nr:MULTISPECIES: cytochrome c [unclassified Variovorax]MDM0118367.1 cytochrome c [Variovorax sp. J2L1-78]MDM0128792.1 cytochrome c [Variovorax sp. J2L1-63]MDM0233422.1 cytochrome c [Variovorax sp. J2R1-6]
MQMASIRPYSQYLEGFARGLERVGWLVVAARARAPLAGLDRGERALYQYACNACHTIPGISGSTPAVGPPLAGIARRSKIAGKLVNNPENMIRWLRDPKAVDPLTSMPAMGINERDARDMAAYLSTLN